MRRSAQHRRDGGGDPQGSPAGFLSSDLVCPGVARTPGAGVLGRRAAMPLENPPKPPLSDGHEQYRLLMENVKDYGIFLLDTQGRVATWNAGAERILGYRQEEIVG